MRRNITIGLCLLLGLVPGATAAHSGKTTSVMQELAAYHASLFRNPEDRIDTTELVRLRRAGGDSKAAAKIFKTAVGDAVKLGAAKKGKDRLDAYAQLVGKLAQLHGFHDKSGTHLFYCPMAKKKWVAQGNTVRNPYLPDMRSCGSIEKH